jgi:hypothetical protein
MVPSLRDLRHVVTRSAPGSSRWLPILMCVGATNLRDPCPSGLPSDEGSEPPTRESNIEPLDEEGPTHRPLTLDQPT